MDSDIIIGELETNEINSFSNLVNTVFDEFVGKDYSEEGNNTFKDYTDLKNILIRFNEKTGKFYAAKYQNEIVGILEIKNNDHISLFFVKKEFHGRGIGKKLFEHFIKHVNSEAETITVNSSIYAEKIYARIGFIKTGEIEETNGIKYIPMSFKLRRKNDRTCK